MKWWRAASVRRRAGGDERCVGHRRAFWEKSCVAIGLAGGFIEPLESTSIHLTQMGIQRLINLWPGRGCNPAEIAHYNRVMTSDYERIRDFIVLHYSATQRDDTEFWRYVGNMEIPNSYDALVDRVPEDALIQNMRLLKQAVAKTAAALPRHEDYIKRQCAAQ